MATRGNAVRLRAQIRLLVRSSVGGGKPLAIIEAWLIQQSKKCFPPFPLPTARTGFNADGRFLGYPNLISHVCIEMLNPPNRPNAAAAAPSSPALSAPFSVIRSLHA